MNQIIRELRAAANALRAASAEVDDISYILGWADGIDHAVSVLDDSDTPGINVTHGTIPDPHDKAAKRPVTHRKWGGRDVRYVASDAYMAHGY